jgi:hypothetical protein
VWSMAYYGYLLDPNTSTPGRLAALCSRR